MDRKDFLKSLGALTVGATFIGSEQRLKAVERAVSSSSDKCAEGLATLLSCAYIQIDQLIGPFGRIRGAHLHGVAHIAQPLKVYTLNRNAILNIKTRDYPFCKHFSTPPYFISSAKLRRILSPVFPLFSG